MDIFLFSANPAGQSSGIMAYLPFFLILAIMYFMMIRPQAKRQKEKQTMKFIFLLLAHSVVESAPGTLVKQ